MFCRFCGRVVQPDSRFCALCGRRLAGRSLRIDALVRTLRLRTPYPYAIGVLLLFAGLVLQPGPPPFDYSNVAFELELLGESREPGANLYRHHFSLIVENLGETRLTRVPVDVGARVEADRPAEVEYDFLGRRLAVVRDSRPIPLTVVLDDDMDASEKRRYSIDGIVIAAPPFTVTYDIVAEGAEDVLATFTAAVGGRGPESAPGSPVARAPRAGERAGIRS